MINSIKLTQTMIGLSVLSTNCISKMLDEQLRYIHAKYDLSVQLCSYSNSFCLMQSFFQNISHNVIWKKYLYMNLHIVNCSNVKYLFVVFFSKFHLKFIYVFNEILVYFIYSIQELAFFLMKMEVK